MLEIPPHLHERYGIRPPSKFRVLWIAISALSIGAVLTFVVFRFVATRNAEAALIEWSTLGETRISVTFQVNAESGERWCAIRAQTFDQFDVGFAVLPVSAAAQTITYEMNTLAAPFTVDLVGCDTDPFRLRGPQFPPGVLPPAQDAPGRAPGVWQ